MEDLISVVVPVYNVEDYLKACLDSVLRQSYKNLEIILVDDGSTDKSGSICEEYAKLDFRLHVIHKENGGLSDARNKGLECATGKYVVFIDSDDVVNEEYVSYLYSLITEGKSEISICDPVHCYPGQQIEFQRESFRKTYTNSNAITEMLYQTSFLVAASGKLFLRSLFDDIKFPKGMLFEDSAIMYRLFAKAENVTYGNAKLYGYMHREGSITTNKFSKRDCDILKISRDIVKFCVSRSDEEKRAARSYQIGAAFRIYLNAPRNGHYDKEIHYCKKVISENAKQVLKDSRVRRKTKAAILMYYFARPLMPAVHQRIDRWK